jgi:hypothetical protein
MAFSTGSVVAGVSAADPFLNGLGGELSFGATTRDIATVLGAYLNPTSGATTNNVTASLSPASTVVTSTSAATYDDTTKRLAFTTTGLAVGDLFEASHSSINSGTSFMARVVTIPVANFVTLVRVSDSIDPFSGGGNRTLVGVQVSWRYIITAGSGNSVSSAGGSANYWRQQAADSASNTATQENVLFIRNAPVDGTYVQINAQDATGTTAAGNTTTPVLSILSGWTNKGGIATVALANHGTQAVNHLKWADSSTGEKTLAAVNALAMGAVTNANGINYGRLVFRSKAASAVTGTVDVQYTTDTTPPTLEAYFLGN